MSNNFKDVTYSGPNLEYKPTIGISSANPKSTSNYVSKGGYHNIDYLKSVLDNLEKVCYQVYSECESELNSYALRVDQNDSTLTQARIHAFPQEAADQLPSTIDERVERYLVGDPNIIYTGGSKWFNESIGKYEWINPNTNQKESFDTMALLRESIKSYLNSNENYGTIPTKTMPGHISFKEYQYYKHHSGTAAADYVATYYEDHVRGPGGTNALDISHLALMTSNEVKRIKEFLNVYIGDVNDPAEFRAIELFQGWAEDAFGHAKDLWEVLTGKVTAEIPRSEVDQLDSKKATELQALFQVKLNIINASIKDLISQTYKNWEDPSSHFYHNNLGPALNFQRRVGSSLSTSFASQKTPVIAAEIQGSLSGLKSNFTVLLADQVKRNKLYSDNIENILMNIGQRDTYCKYIDQLSDLGKKISGSFTSTSTEINTAFQSYAAPLETVDTSANMIANTVFQPLHSLLSGTETPDAHAQYLLRSGGQNSKITGDIFLEEGVKIDGIIPSKHSHNGLDGSVKIKGSDIEYNSVTDGNVDNTNSSTTIPSDLLLLDQVVSIVPPGITKVAARVSFNVDKTNIVQYEFEITPIPTAQATDEAQVLIDSSSLFNDFRFYKRDNETQLPSKWLSGGEIVTVNSGKIDFDSKGLLLLENHAEIYINTDNFSSTAFTLVWHMSRDKGWTLSDYGEPNGTESFQIQLINNNLVNPINTNARILTVLNSTDQVDIGTIHTQVTYDTPDSETNIEMFSDTSTSLHDFGDIYHSMSDAIMFMSFNQNGVTLTSYGLNTGTFSQGYIQTLPSQTLNTIILTTDRFIVSSPNTPVIRLHALGLWNKELTKEEIAKIAAYLLK